MAQRKSRRLEPVHRLEAMREDAALEELAAAMARLREARARLAQLEDFALEYRGRMLGSGQGPVSGRSLQGMARFQEHLEGLIAAQMRICALAEEALGKAREGWRAAHARQRAVHSAIDRFRDREALEDSRREQRELDELGIRRRNP